jgi:hypothetical protein
MVSSQNGPRLVAVASLSGRGPDLDIMATPVSIANTRMVAEQELRGWVEVW